MSVITANSEIQEGIIETEKQISAAYEGLICSPSYPNASLQLPTKALLFSSLLFFSAPFSCWQCILEFRTLQRSLARACFHDWKPGLGNPVDN